MLRRLLSTGLFSFLVLLGDLYAESAGSGRSWVSLGYRQDDFSWSIAGPNHYPTTLSELSWDKLHMLNAELYGWHSDSCIPYVRWYGSYSAIMHGSVSDSDFAANHRKCEFSRSRSDCNRGSVIEGSGALGWPLIFCWYGLIQVSPVLGVSWHQQHLHMDRGSHLIDIENPSLGRRSIHGLHSEYRSRWWGPWIGADLFWEHCPRLAFNAGYEYHWGVSYRGRGDWNLRDDFCGGFHHAANGKGWIARLGGEFAFDCLWLFKLDLSYRNLHAGKGVDRTRVHYLACDEKKRPVGFNSQMLHSPFNGAEWHSFSAALGLVYRY